MFIAYMNLTTCVLSRRTALKRRDSEIPPTGKLWLIRKILLHFMNTMGDESPYYKRSLVKGRCKHNCKFHHKCPKKS